MNNTGKGSECLLNITDIQHFSVGDGPGIRTTVFFKGCNLRCPWCHNPETQSPEQQICSDPSDGRKTSYGRLVPLDRVMKEIIADESFYRESGGGLTVSGGECMLYPEELLRLLTESGKHGIPAAVDTAGFVPYESFERINPYVSLYLFDIKTADAAKYRSIGGDLMTIAGNAEKLIGDGKNVVIRVPLIPGFNDDDASLTALGELTAGIGGRRVELLPFHRLGSGKYRLLGRKYEYEKIPSMKVSYAESKLVYFKSRGIDAAVDG